MTLLTAHRILIGTAVAFFVFYGAWEIRAGRAGAPGGGLRGAIALIAALALLIYFRTLARPSDGSGGDDR